MSKPDTSPNTMSETLHRSFYHELGHFVAFQLNNKFFNGPKVKSFEIFPCDGKRDIFCGKVTPVKPETENDSQKNLTREELASYVAVLLYGCIFQSVITKGELLGCLSDNGKQDFEDFQEALDHHKFFFAYRAIVNIANIYCRLLKEQNLLVEFANIDPFPFLKETSPNQYTAYVDRLKTELSSGIQIHSEHYQDFVKDIKAVLDGIASSNG